MNAVDAGGAAAFFGALCARSSGDWPAAAAAVGAVGLVALPLLTLATVGAASLGSPPLLACAGAVVCGAALGLAPAVGLARTRRPERAP